MSKRATPPEDEALPEGVYRRPNSPSLWGRVCFGGHEYRQSLLTHNPVQAGASLRRWEKELRRDAAEPVEAGETWKQAVVRWTKEVLPTSNKPSSARRYLVSIAMLDPHFSELRLSEITTRRIADYVSSRSGTVSNATIRRDLTAMSRLLSACCAWGWLDGNPVQLFDRTIVREKNRRFTPPTPEEFETFLGYAPAPMQAILRFLDATGCRLQEGVDLSRHAVDRQSQVITLVDTKTRPRAIPFVTVAGDVTPILEAAVPHVHSPYLFRTRNGLPYTQMSTNFLEVMGRAQYAEARAGRSLRRFRIHDLRHGFAIRWLRRGGSIYDLKEHLGHTTVSTTEIYLDYVTADEADIAKRGVHPEGGTKSLSETAHGPHTGLQRSAHGNKGFQKA